MFPHPTRGHVLLPLEQEGEGGGDTDALIPCHTMSVSGAQNCRLFCRQTCRRWGSRATPGQAHAGAVCARAPRAGRHPEPPGKGSAARAKSGRSSHSHGPGRQPGRATFLPARRSAPGGGGGRAGDIGQAPRGGRAGLGAHGEPGTRGCGAHSPGSWLRGAGRNAVGSGNWVRPARAAFCSAPGKACPGPRQPVGFAHCTTPGLMSWREAPRRCTPTPPPRPGWPDGVGRRRRLCPCGPTVRPCEPTVRSSATAAEASGAHAWDCRGFPVRQVGGCGCELRDQRPGKLLPLVKG